MAEYPEEDAGQEAAVLSAHLGQAVDHEEVLQEDQLPNNSRPPSVYVPQSVTNPCTFKQFVVFVLILYKISGRTRPMLNVDAQSRHCRLAHTSRNGVLSAVTQCVQFVRLPLLAFACEPYRPGESVPNDSFRHGRAKC